ncbi:hypothetical protein L9F63_000086, partial [Diploptera punctata]
FGIPKCFVVLEMDQVQVWRKWIRNRCKWIRNSGSGSVLGNTTGGSGVGSGGTDYGGSTTGGG